jgi:hypothetical protein
MEITASRLTRTELERLGDEIAHLAAHLHAATHELLVRLVRYSVARWKQSPKLSMVGGVLQLRTPVMSANTIHTDNSKAPQKRADALALLVESPFCTSGPVAAAEARLCAKRSVTMRHIIAVVCALWLPGSVVEAQRSGSQQRDAEESIVAAIRAVLSRTGRARQDTPIIIVDRVIPTVDGPEDRPLGQRVAARLRLPGRSLASLRVCSGSGNRQTCEFTVNNIYSARIVETAESSATVVVDASDTLGVSTFTVSMVNSGGVWTVKGFDVLHGLTKPPRIRKLPRSS